MISYLSLLLTWKTLVGMIASSYLTRRQSQTKQRVDLINPLSHVLPCLFCFLFSLSLFHLLIRFSFCTRRTWWWSASRPWWVGSLATKMNDLSRGWRTPSMMPARVVWTTPRSMGSASHRPGVSGVACPRAIRLRVKTRTRNRPRCLSDSDDCRGSRPTPLHVWGNEGDDLTPP